MSAPRSLARLLVAAAVLLPVTLGAVPVHAEPAPSLGTLRVTPGTGLDTSRSSVSTTSTGTAKGCPADTANVFATAVGPGGWAGGILVLGTTDQDFSTTDDFTMALGDSWLGIARSNSTTLGVGRYEITLSCVDATTTVVFGSFTGSVWFSDATHFQDSDPATSAVPSDTRLTTSPVSVADRGTRVTLTATVSPSTATGRVQFTTDQGQGPVDLGGTVPVSDGRATLSRTDLPLGLYTFGAVFQPSSDGRSSGSVSEGVTFAVRKPPPPTNRVLPSVRGTARPGYRLSCSRGTWAGATSYRYWWLRDGRAIARATATTYLLTKTDAGHKMSCQVAATNEGGTIRRTSAAVRVAPR